MNVDAFLLVEEKPTQEKKSMTIKKGIWMHLNIESLIIYPYKLSVAVAEWFCRYQPMG